MSTCANGENPFVSKIDENSFDSSTFDWHTCSTGKLLANSNDRSDSPEPSIEQNRSRTFNSVEAQ